MNSNNDVKALCFAISFGLIGFLAGLWLTDAITARLIEPQIPGSELLAPR